ncbi:DegV family protein [Spiroplasma endosymbiont of Asaphidion curtum]|uniref:DegV family protein n=1 Tax=Spiroplasma endosymbiont of Asaphidion curtum TaxID=3066281 RepID=UPI00313BD590
MSNANKKIAIIVDSSSNLDLTTLKEKNINIIPLLISFEDGTEIEDTISDIKKSNFYARVKSGEYTKTSQSSPGKLINLWRKLLTEGNDEIIFIPIAKGLSGQYQNAYILSQEIEFKNRVHIIDTNGAATFNSTLAIKASEIIANGGNISDINKMVTQLKKNSLIYIIPQDISRLSKGGRAKSVVASLISLIRVKVIIKFGEISEKSGIARTLNNAIESVITKIKEFIKNENYILEILTSQCDKKVTTIINKIITTHPELKIKKAFLPNCFVSHAGVNSVGIIVVKQ